MEVLIVGDRIRLAQKLRKINQVMRIISKVIDNNDTAKRANDSMAEDVRQVAEELFPQQMEREQLSRNWNLDNTYVKYNRGDQFATLHGLDSHDILALCLIKYDQANYSADVVLPEYASRKITTKHAWFLLVEHLAENHRLSSQKASTR